MRWRFDRTGPVEMLCARCKVVELLARVKRCGRPAAPVEMDRRGGVFGEREGDTPCL